jgi:uncharacterized protein (DUF433 family)
MTCHERALLERITINPKILNGRPVIRSLPLAVEQILAMLAAGKSYEVVLSANPLLEQDDILACLEYARRLVACMRLAGADLPSD